MSNCCGMTPNDKRHEWPRYFAALHSAAYLHSEQQAEIAAEPYTPDEPAGLCWDCRRLHRAGIDGPALVAVDARVRDLRAAAGDRGEGIKCCGDVMYWRADGSASQRLCGGCAQLDAETRGGAYGCGDVIERYSLDMPYCARA